MKQLGILHEDQASIRMPNKGHLADKCGIIIFLVKIVILQVMFIQMYFDIVFYYSIQYNI